MSGAQSPTSNQGRGVSFMDIGPPARNLSSMVSATVKACIQQLHETVLARARFNGPLPHDADVLAAKNLASKLFPNVSVEDHTVVLLKAAIVDSSAQVVERYLSIISPQLMDQLLPEMTGDENGDGSKLRQRMTTIHRNYVLILPPSFVRFVEFMIRAAYNSHRQHPDCPSPAYSHSFDGLVHHLDSDRREAQPAGSHNPTAGQAPPMRVRNIGSQEASSLNSPARASASNSPIVISSAGSRASPTTARSPAQSGYQTPHRPLPHAIQVENEATPSAHGRGNRRVADLEAQQGAPLNNPLEDVSLNDNQTVFRALVSHVRTIRDWTFWRRELMASGVDPDASYPQPHHCVHEHFLVNSNPQLVLHYCRECIESRSSSTLSPGLLNEYGLISSRTVYREEMEELLGIAPSVVGRPQPEGQTEGVQDGAQSPIADRDNRAVELRPPPALPARLSIDSLAKAAADICVAIFVGISM